MQVFGLLGNPVGHSLSPPMHEAAYDELGLDARYVTFEPARTNLETAIFGANALGITGLNVTIPFKEDVLKFVDADDLAVRVGAVNTIDFTGKTPTGHNTDVAGIQRAFESHDVSLDGTTAVVVGAGGAGRAAAFALADEGAAVTICNRTAERARNLGTEVPGATGGGLEQLERVVPDADVLVNATSVGMDRDETPVPKRLLHEDLVVLDAVYRPLETRLLREARTRGATTIDGACMLLYQGVEAFELWTKTQAPIEVMDAALRARI